jgi:hypothetical protein
VPAPLAEAFPPDGGVVSGGRPTGWALLSLGGGGGGLPFHSHGDGWLAVVHGAKHWLLYPPGGMPPEARPVSQTLLSAAGWARRVLPALPAELRPLQCTQAPGEALFVPAGWLHATLNRVCASPLFVRLWRSGLRD